MMFQWHRRSHQRTTTLEILLALLTLCHTSGATHADANQIPAKYGQSLAIVIGIDRYADPSWKDLQYAHHGAVAVAKLLRKKGFDVQVLLDEAATHQAIRSAFTDIARRLKARDRVLIYFAGHGHTESIGGNDWGYVVPHDGSDVDSYISMRDLQNMSELMGNALHQLFLMDACYGGMFGQTRDRLGTYAQRPGLIKSMMHRQARQYITAGGKDQTVLDAGPSGHSIFTGELLHAIDDGFADQDDDGVVTFAELASYMEVAASNQHQTPAYGNLLRNQGGSFLFGVDSPGDTEEVAQEQTIEENPTLPSGQRRSAGNVQESVGNPPKAPQTYRVREGSPQSLDDLGVTAAVSFSTVEKVPLATLIVGASGSSGSRQPAFGTGTSLIFEADDLTLQGTVLGIDWNLKEVTFTLGRRK